MIFRLVLLLPIKIATIQTLGAHRVLNTITNHHHTPSVAWADPIETSSLPTIASRQCDSSSGDDSTSFSIGDDDDDFFDDEDDNCSIIISNMEMLDQAMSQFESTFDPFFFDAYENPQDELMVFLDI